MCGWVAVIGIEDQPSRGLVEHMRDQLVHRGPDGKGFGKEAVVTVMFHLGSDGCL